MLKILFQNIFLPDGKAILSFLLFIYLYIYIYIEYIKGSQNTIPNFLTREFLQCYNGK